MLSGVYFVTFVFHFHVQFREEQQARIPKKDRKLETQMTGILLFFFIKSEFHGVLLKKDEIYLTADLSYPLIYVA